jgi:hypothetical protein
LGISWVDSNETTSVMFTIVVVEMYPKDNMRVRHPSAVGIKRATISYSTINRGSPSSCSSLSVMVY